MRIRIGRIAALPAAALLALAAPGCAPLAAMEDVVGTSAPPGSVRSSSLYGEVRSVDTRRSRIQLREQRGRDYTVRFDNRTQVLYGQRRYPVSALERGDIVQVRIAYDRYNEAWAQRIDVRDTRRRNDDRDYRDNRGTSVQRYDGHVRTIDVRRGFFTLDRSRGASLVVVIPRNARREDIRRFERLRRNDRVRVEVRVRGNSNQAELVRFR